jgi:uncharacterized sulfatase
VDLPDQTFATMYRERRWKLITYHGISLGELYDMEHDPQEFTNLWDDPEFADVKTDLLIKSFDATVAAEEFGARRAMPY